MIAGAWAIVVLTYLHAALDRVVVEEGALLHDCCVGVAHTLREMIGSLRIVMSISASEKERPEIGHMPLRWSGGSKGDWEL